MTKKEETAYKRTCNEMVRQYKEKENKYKIK